MAAKVKKGDVRYLRYHSDSLWSATWTWHTSKEEAMKDIGLHCTIYTVKVLSVLQAEPVLKEVAK